MPKKESVPKRSTLSDIVTRDYTIHLHKHVFGKSFKRRAPTALKAIRRFAQKAMATPHIVIDPKVNKAVWSQGIKNVPHRIRVRLSRRRNDDEDAKHKLYTVVTHVPVVSFKGLQNETVEA